MHREQSQTISQVNESVISIDRTTQESVGLIDSSAQVSSYMSQEATDLKALVEDFKMMDKFMQESVEKNKSLMHRVQVGQQVLESARFGGSVGANLAQMRQHIRALGNKLQGIQHSLNVEVNAQVVQQNLSEIQNWLAYEGLEQFGQQSEFKLIKDTFSILQQSAKDLIPNVVQGHIPANMTTQATQMIVLSTTLGDLLDTLEQAWVKRQKNAQ